MIKLLKSKKGNMVVWAPVMLLGALLFGVSLFEYSRLTTVAVSTRDAVQAAITQVCAENSRSLYDGLRDGYSGGYKIQNAGWTENVGSGDIMAMVDAKLGSSGGVKTEDGKTEFSITGLSVEIENAPVAPDDSDSAEPFSGTATYTLTVPLSFGWSALPPMTQTVTVRSGYSQQGPVTGGDSGGGETEASVSKIVLNRSAMTLAKGDNEVIAASVLPDDAEDRAVSWASADSSVCSVTQSGIVTGVSPGETDVVAISHSGVMAQCSVSVVSPVAGLTLDKFSVTLIKGAEEPIQAVVSPSDASDKDVSWVSSDPSVCTVDESGKVTAAGAGQSTVTAMTREGGFYAECVVKVIISVSGLTLDKTAMTVARGTTDTLLPTIYPSDATQQDVLWASSNSSVCTVDSSGNISAVGAGTAVISATSKDGKFVAGCVVTVVVPVTGVTVDPSSITLTPGQSRQLTAAVSPADATNKVVKWSSSDSSVAAVSSSGTVTAVGSGRAVVTVTTDDGGFSAGCTVTVTVPVTGVSLNKTRLTLRKGKSAALTATVSPSDATDKAVRWSSSDPDVVTVNSSGTVTAVASGGTAVITVTTHDGEFTASCKVTTAIPVTGISLDKTSLALIQGDSAALTATISPSDATDKAVTWSSSDTAVVTVSSSGVITSKGYGTATVTAKTRDGGFTASCKVTVQAAVQVKIVSTDGASSGGYFYRYGKGNINVFSTYWDDDPEWYTTIVDLTFAKPVTYHAANKHDYYDGISPAKTLIQFVDADSQSGDTVRAALTLYDMDRNKVIAYQGRHEPWFDDIRRYGLMLSKSGQATHFRFTLTSKLWATENDDDEAFLSWDKIIFCGIPLTDIQVLS